MSDINDLELEDSLDPKARATIRIRDLIAKTKELEAALQASQQENAKLSKKQEDMKLSFEKTMEEMTKNFHTEKLEMQVSTAISSLGIEDSDAIDFIKHKYNNMKLEEGKEKPSFKDFLEQNKDASFIKNFIPKKEEPVVAKEEVKTAEKKEEPQKPMTAREKLQALQADIKKEVLVDPTSVQPSQKSSQSILDASTIASMSLEQWKQVKNEVIANMRK